MRSLIVLVCLSVVCLSAPTIAQEGHPLKGSWLGTWGPSKIHSNDILIILNWDGKTISGMINPGTDNMPIKSASLEPKGWVVKLQADGKDKDGSVVSYVIEGKIENLELPNRSINGTWSSNKGSGAFTASRQ
jgi:hypothetical protein